MTKIVYNACYGGFGLSDEAIQRYAEIAGITLYSRTDEYGFTSWCRVPAEEYEQLKGSERNDAYFSVYDIERTDPALVQVVEELGDRANDTYSELYIEELLEGTRYRIDEYVGLESVMTIDDYDWRIA